jgi:hypothetical protein
VTYIIYSGCISQPSSAKQDSRMKIKFNFVKKENKNKANNKRVLTSLLDSRIKIIIFLYHKCWGRDIYLTCH